MDKTTRPNTMEKLVYINFIIFALLCKVGHGEKQTFKIFRFGDDNLLGTGSDEDSNGEDYLIIQPVKAVGRPLPKRFSLCFNMFYLAMDYWNKNQKTILRINGENDNSSSTDFFMKINRNIHSYSTPLE